MFEVREDGRFERAGQTGCAHSVGKSSITSDDRVFAGAGTHIGHGLRGDKRSGFSGGIARKTRERSFFAVRVVGGELGARWSSVAVQFAMPISLPERTGPVLGS